MTGRTATLPLAPGVVAEHAHAERLLNAYVRECVMGGGSRPDEPAGAEPANASPAAASTPGQATGLAKEAVAGGVSEPSQPPEAATASAEGMAWRASQLLTGDAALAAMPERLRAAWRRAPRSAPAQPELAGVPLVVTLPHSGTAIAGTLLRWSAMGHHRYGEAWWAIRCASSAADGGGAASREAESDAARRLDSARELADVLLGELARREGDNDAAAAAHAAMLERIDSSIRNMRSYLEAAAGETLPLPALHGAERVRRAEQGVRLGHPFHPAPKSSQGFTAADRAAYAPELGAAFVLHYFAVAPALLREMRLDEPAASPEPEDVRAAARERLAPAQQGYALLPAHPWQAAYLLERPAVRRLIAAGRLVALGALGAPVYPTSSVRTVWQPQAAHMLKLPLHVRLTHFIRTNPAEHLTRALEASRVLAALAQAHPYGDSFVILLEDAGRSLDPAALEATGEVRQHDGGRTMTASGGRAAASHEAGAGAIGGGSLRGEGGEADPAERTGEAAQPGDAAEARALEADFGVVYRRNPARATPAGELADRDSPMVVAALLEPDAADGQAPLGLFVRQAAGARGTAADEAFAAQWLARYAELALAPLLWLFAARGVSLEAHAQNALIALEDGWPARFFVRDLEGASISVARDRGQSGLRADHPAMYADAEAWQRFEYYVLVNHFGHLVAVLAEALEADERRLWRTVYETVRTSAPLRAADAGLADAFFGRPCWAAKANLVSAFRRRGETPDYVAVPNPLATVEVAAASAERASSFSGPAGPAQGKEAGGRAVHGKAADPASEPSTSGTGGANLAVSADPDDRGPADAAPADAALADAVQADAAQADAALAEGVEADPASAGSLFHVPPPVAARLSAAKREDPARPVCAYVYDLTQLRAHAARLIATLPDGCELFYAVKANAEAPILRALAGIVHGFETASAGEIAKVRAAAGAAVPILYGGPVKTDEALAAALERGVRHIHVEGPLELRRLDRLAAARGLVAPVLLRVNVGDALPDATLVMAGSRSQFGIDECRLPELAELARTLEHVRIEGFHLHSLSNNLSCDTHLELLESYCARARQWMAVFGLETATLNAGGGIGVNYRDAGAQFDWDGFVRGLAERIAPLRPPGLRLVFECGRYIAAASGYYAAEVIDVKTNHGSHYALLRGGTHHFRLPASWQHSHPFRILPVEAWPYPFARPELRRCRITLAGELCTPKDALARDVPVERVRVGDIAVFPYAGAYGWAISHHDFLSHPHPRQLYLES
ncbi:alanine racemase [Paenibacillus sp. IB182496]|uniref:Alanine racemase n=1 Tax=Paenibacillus sabuli TaxID=2772509 RepID=A0A927GU25_9BACL|nr:IucA/IucC family protein [Paenibacillus sabuli]MBD2848474.1 alanine racemase [Paenibacillus sabuli]